MQALLHLPNVLLIAIIEPAVCVFISKGANVLVMFANIKIRQLAFLPVFQEVKGMAGVDLVSM